MQMMFQDRSRRVFAILDGALIDDLPARLAGSGLAYECLFPGDLDVELAAVMPYLVEMQPAVPLLREALTKGWKEHWGIFGWVPANVTFQDLRQHFRPFLKVQGPMGQFMFFRYYDPRVLRHTLDAFDDGQRSAFFGPAQAIWAEMEDGTQVAEHSRDPEPRILHYEAGGG